MPKFGRIPNSGYPTLLQIYYIVWKNIVSSKKKISPTIQQKDEIMSYDLLRTRLKQTIFKK